MTKECIKSAATIEEATAAALTELGLTDEDDYHVEVLKLPSKKILGLFGGWSSRTRPPRKRRRAPKRRKNRRKNRRKKRQPKSPRRRNPQKKRKRAIRRKAQRRLPKSRFRSGSARRV